MGKGRQYRERLQFHLSYKLDGATYARASKEEIQADIAAAKAHFAKKGEQNPNTPGVHIIGNWRNPERFDEWKTSDDTGQSLFGFWASIWKRVH